MSLSRQDQQRGSIPGVARSPVDAPAAGMPEIQSIVAETSLTPGGVRRPRRGRRNGGSAAEPSRAATTAGAATYRILRTTEVDPYDPPVAAADIPVFGGPDIALPLAAPSGDRFQGTSRKAAKLAIADADVEVFADLPSLIASLAPDNRMIRRRPRISTGPDSDRVSEEKRNVRVRAFLYAASREDDNDFHLIVGSDRDAGPLTCMTIELSGLPPSSSRSYRRLKKARDAYKAFFGTNLPGMSYDFYPTPIPVEIQGSLFFDMSHATGGRPGPNSLRRFIPTIWEVHPITRIVFEP